MALKTFLLVQFHSDIQRDGKGDKEKAEEAFIRVARVFPEIKEAYLCTGSYGGVLLIQTKGEEEARRISGAISKMPGIASVNPLRNVKKINVRQARWESI